MAHMDTISAIGLFANLLEGKTKKQSSAITQVVGGLLAVFVDFLKNIQVACG